MESSRDFVDYFHTDLRMQPMTDEPNLPGSGLFHRVLGGLLRPLIRALIAQGVTAPAFYRLVKRVYVDVAEEEFSLDGKRVTDSRISVLTGVHRRDVAAIRTAPSDGDAALREKVTLITSVLGRWMASAQTTGSDGKALPLQRSGTGTGTGGPSFESLVASINRDVRPRTVLDEMLRQDLVRAHPETGLLHLNAQGFVGPEDMDQRIYFFGENVGDHVAAAVDNLLTDQPPHLERAVFYNRLTPKSVDNLETRARTLGTEALQALNREAHALQQDDLEAEDSTERFRFGVFFYRTSEEADDQQDQAEAPEEPGPDDDGGGPE